MKQSIFSLAFLFISLSCFSQSLSYKWTTDTLLHKPESAIYDRQKDILYISNINGNYASKDGNGFISKIKPNGEIETLKWIDGLDGPQGMGLYQNNLYVADIDKVVRINTNTAKVERVFEIQDALFLNDITIDKNGDVYVSDCRNNKIYRLINDKIETWLVDSLLSTPNGLLCTDKDILILNMKNGIVYTVDKVSKKLSEFINGIDDCDGIVSDGTNGYFISGAWQGKIYHVNAKGIKRLVLDLGMKKINAADIEYITDKKLLVIPTLGKTVIAYKNND